MRTAPLGGRTPAVIKCRTSRYDAALTVIGKLDWGLLSTDTNGRSPVYAYGPASASRIGFSLPCGASSASIGADWPVPGLPPASSREAEPVRLGVPPNLLVPNATATTTAKTARSAAIARGPAFDQKESSRIAINFSRATNSLSSSNLYCDFR